MPNKQSKPQFVRFMLNQETKRGAPFSGDEKRIAWKAWQQAWNHVRVQLRREMRAILKQEIKDLRKRSDDGKLQNLAGDLHGRAGIEAPH
jgi:hypothetical protein